MHFKFQNFVHNSGCFSTKRIIAAYTEHFSKGAKWLAKYFIAMCAK